MDALWDLLLDEYEERPPPGYPDLFAGVAAITVRQTLADPAHHGAVVVTGAKTGTDHDTLRVRHCSAPRPGRCTSNPV